MTQKHFERHWSKADQFEAAGNYGAAKMWNAIAKAQLELDPQYAHKSTVQALEAQSQRLTQLASGKVRFANASSTP